MISFSFNTIKLDVNQTTVPNLIDIHAHVELAQLDKVLAILVSTSNLGNVEL